MKSDIIKDIRHYRGMTQEQFADWLGVHYSTIALVESNHRQVSDTLASKIALKFDITDDDFIAYQQRRKQTSDYFFNS